MAPLIWGQAGDGVTESTRPLMVKSKGLYLPGVTGNHASSPDVNLLDASEAHMTGGLSWEGYFQSVFSSPPMSPLYPDFSDQSLSWVATAGPLSYIRPKSLTDPLFAVSEGDVLSFTATILCENADRPVVAAFRLGDIGGGFVSAVVDTKVSVDGQYVTCAITVTVPAGVAFAAPYVGSTGAEAGDVFHVGRACLRRGADPTFIPSTRITGDIDLRAKAALNWSGTGNSQYFLGHNTRDGQGEGYAFYILPSPSANLRFEVGEGTGWTNTQSSVSPSTVFGDGKQGWVRVTHDVSAFETRFFTSSDDGETWDLLGSPVTGVGMAPTPTSKNIFWGASAATIDLFKGALHRAEVRDGIDGPVVASFDAGVLEESSANLLDAGTAGISSSIGKWVSPTPSTVPPLVATTLATALRFTSNNTGNLFVLTSAGVNGVPVLPSTEYSLTADFLHNGGSTRTVDLYVAEYDGAGTLLGTTNPGNLTPVADQTWVTLTNTFTTQATTAYLRLTVLVYDSVTGEDYYLSSVCLRKGSDPTFIFPNGAGISDEGHTVATFRSGTNPALLVRPCWVFTGSEWLEIADRPALNFGTGDFSVAVGFSRTSDTSLFLPAIAKATGPSANAGWYIGPQGNSLNGMYFKIMGESGTLTEDVSVAEGAPNHGPDFSTYVGVREGDVLYFQNDEKSGQDLAGADNLNVDNTVPVTLGRYHTGNLLDAGMVSWVALWNRALTAAERAELAAWDGSGQPPTFVLSSVLYLNAADPETARSYPDVHNTLQSLLHPQMGSAALRERKRYLPPNSGSKLWDAEFYG